MTNKSALTIPGKYTAPKTGIHRIRDAIKQASPIEQASRDISVKAHSGDKASPPEANPSKTTASSANELGQEGV